MPQRRLVLINPCNRVSLYDSYHWEPLSLAYVAACAPAHWSVELIDEQIEGELDYSMLEADLGSRRSPRRRPVPTALLLYCDSAVSRSCSAAYTRRSCRMRRRSLSIRSVWASAKSVLAGLLADFERGELKARYQGQKLPFAEQSLLPDRRIFRKYSYQYASAQTSRGCPMDCSFCSVTAFNGSIFRMRAVADVIAELQAIESRDLLLVDDDLNGFSPRARQRCLELCRAMIDARLDKRWITQVTINFGDDDELPRLARRRAASACSSASRALIQNRSTSFARMPSRGGAASPTTRRT